MRTLAVCCMALFCLFGAVPSVAAQNASAARHSPADVVAAMVMYTDAKTVRQSLEDIQYMKKAGFVYQAGLAVPADICPRPNDKDQVAVLSGMRSADRAFALFFGKPKEAARENALVRTLRPDLRLPELTKAELAVLRKNPSGAKGREILIRRMEQESEIVRAAARKSEEHLRLWAAHIYGFYLEQLYVTGIMALAAAESDNLEPLHKTRPGIITLQGKMLAYAGSKNLIGHKEFSTHRAKVIERMRALLRADAGGPGLNELKELVDIARVERAPFLTPCP